MKVSFGGIGETVATFYNDETYPAAAGDPVKLTGNGEVGEAANGERFAGIAVSADADYAAVQLGGYIVAGYTGTAPAVGFARLVTDGAGKVKADAGTSGSEHLVIDVDTTAKTVGFIL